jgi:transposase, IS5 family
VFVLSFNHEPQGRNTPMRNNIAQQRPLVAIPFAHEHACELRALGLMLDAMPQAAARIQKCLLADGVNAERGRKGMSAEQVLRALLAKQMNRWSYEELAFHLSDSIVYRAFCNIGIADEAPSRSTLQRNIKMISEEALEAVHKMLVLHAQKLGMERGERIRTDSTVIKSAIHAPTDSSLLWDCVRALVRHLRQAGSMLDIHFTDHRRVAKRRALQIQNVPTMEQRIVHYHALLKVTDETTRVAEQVMDKLRQRRRGRAARKAALLANHIEHSTKLARRVMSQTRQRIFWGRSVLSTEKVVSIFEPHTDIIVKDRRETLYGHKVFLTQGASGLVLDLLLPTGNPADATLAVTAVRRQRELYGHSPKQACFDGGFTSHANLAALKELGVGDIVFSKAKGIPIAEMAKTAWVYRKLRHFRAGIEAGISLLKRCFGWDRCTWKGWPSFKAYAWASILAANAIMVARYLLTK